ncbi:MAG: hypothetical protein MK213_07200, partial [Planctomycetes bacterium]|nr:hypothetical protein [Planctomycetota bacterium]
MRLFLSLSLLTLSPSPVQDPFDEARTLLSAEKPREAEESVLRGLAQDPYSQTGYRIALDAAA